MKRRKAIILTIATAFTTSAIVLAGFFMSDRGDTSRPEITITFLGYTNLAEGKPAAQIKIQNAGRPVRRAGFYAIVQSPNFSSIPLAGEKVIGSKKSELMNVEPPLRSGLWSANFTFKREPNIFSKCVLNIRAKVGWLKPRSTVSQYDESFVVSVGEIPDRSHAQTDRSTNKAVVMK